MLIGIVVVILVAFGATTWVIITHQMQRHDSEQIDWVEHGSVQTLEHEVPAVIQPPEPRPVRLAPHSDRIAQTKMPDAWHDEWWWDD